MWYQTSYLCWKEQKTSTIVTMPAHRYISCGFFSHFQRLFADIQVSCKLHCTIFFSPSGFLYFLWDICTIAYTIHTMYRMKFFFSIRVCFFNFLRFSSQWTPKEHCTVFILQAFFLCQKVFVICEKGFCDQSLREDW